MMDTVTLQSMLSQMGATQQIKTAVFIPGQIINGKILKLFPERMAEVQIGSQKLIAQLEAPLSTNERYWLQVQPGDGNKIQLKVMAAAEDTRQSEGLGKILRGLSVPVTKENLELIRYFVKEKLPVSKETLPVASNLLRSANSKSEGLEAVKMILTRALPLTPATFSALYTFNKESSLIQLMIQLHGGLTDLPPTETIMKSKALLEELLPLKKGTEAGSPPPVDLDSNPLSPAKIKKFLSTLGMSYERQLFSEADTRPAGEQRSITEGLKPQLLRLMHEQPPQAVKDAAEQIVNKITGFQLLSQESGPVQQLVMQLPIIIGGKMNEITMQWSGKKAPDGKIDAGYCRILFYLKLGHLKETVIDVQIQNRVMSIGVINEQPALSDHCSQLLPELKSKLSEIGYLLSSLSLKAPEENPAGGGGKMLADLYGKKEYTGVDIKI